MRTSSLPAALFFGLSIQRLVLPDGLCDQDCWVCHFGDEIESDKGEEVDQNVATGNEAYLFDDADKETIMEVRIVKAEAPQQMWKALEEAYVVADKKRLQQRNASNGDVEEGKKGKGKGKGKGKTKGKRFTRKDIIKT